MAATEVGEGLALSRLEGRALPTHLARGRLMAVGVAGAGLGALTAATTLDGYGHTGLAAGGRVLLVAMPVAVGAYAASRKSTARFGRVLVIAGFVSFLATLAESRASLLYSIGRVSEWLLELLLVYLILSFPSGRLTGRIDRGLIAAAAGLVAALFLPTALLVSQYPLPAPYTSCTSGCPHNAFMVLGSAPAVVGGIVAPARELLLIVLLAAVTLRLAWRVRGATRVMRCTLSPVLTAAIVRLLAFVGALGLRRVDPGAPLLDPLLWVMALALPVLAAGFLVGLVRWQLYVADALQKLSARLSRSAGEAELRAALAESFEDPTLSLAFPAPDQSGRWLGVDRQPASLPEPNSGRCCTRVWAGGETVAVIIHDGALADHRPFIEAVAGYTLISLQNNRLSSELQASLEKVGESRARLLAAADGERRRIERDLHDGAQQRLVALRMRLELAEELVSDAPEKSRERLHALADELDDALEEIRNLARGVYPPQLASQGLAAALRSAALRTPLTARVTSRGIGRYPQELESAIYFCCLEALQNASKHATGASEVTIALVDQGASLEIKVQDDGRGFDTKRASGGAGLTNMADRLAAVGGNLTVSSAPGLGTTVQGHVPIGPDPVSASGPVTVLGPQGTQ